jgi:membrane-associated phospholipid phosphatase
MARRTPPARRWRVTAVGAAWLALTSALVACGDNGGRALDPVVRPEPTAGAWKTWVLAAGNEIAVPIPPARDSDKARADLRAVQLAATKRTASTRNLVDKWSGPLPTKPWTQTAFDLVSKGPVDPPLATRNYALLHVAMADAVIAAYQWKYEYEVKAPAGVTTLVPASPDPSYPSEHAAIAGAASKVLAYLFPGAAASRFDGMAADAARSRVDAGTNTPSDVEAGLALGRAVADKVIAYAKADGAGTPWNGRRPAGITDAKGFWQPAPGVTSAPIDPEAGGWKGWVLADNAVFRPPPPPAYNSAELKAAAQDAVEVRRNLTEDQKRVAKFWEGGDGTRSPGGLTLTVALPDLEKAAGEGGKATRWTLPQATRALAMLTTALADAGIAAWDASYAYWYPRPENVVRDLGVDRSYAPFLPTPPSPGYPSDSAAYAGAAEVVMTYLFPKRAGEVRARAVEQIVARVYAGTEWRFDSASQDAGRRISQLVMARVKGDTLGGKA